MKGDLGKIEDRSHSIPHSCDLDGHVWVYIGSADGIDFYRCSRCGKEADL